VAALAAGIALVAGGIGIWLAFGRAAPGAAAQSAPAAPVGAPGVPVTVTTVTPGDVPVFANGIGTVQAFNAVQIKSRVDGAIVAVDFTEGEEVAAGTLLLQIDPRPYQAALAQAQAARAKDVAQLKSAELDLERYSKLVGNGFQTRQSVDQQTAMVAQLKAAIDGDQAQIDTTRLNLDYAQIRAPIAGRLGARLVDIGNLVRATDNAALVTITQVRPIFVSFTLPQQTFAELRQEQTKAPLAVEAFAADGTQKLGDGKLTLIDNAIDGSTGTIHLKAQFDNASELLWPGEFVNARVILSVRRAVPTVPSQAVQQGTDGYVAFVVKPGDTVDLRSVQVAAIQDGIAAVTQGLAPGERVVVTGQYRLTNGARVSPVAAPVAASAAAPQK
jgi:multidrug efflux system membrane fusion protein